MANELSAMAASLGALLKERKETVAVSESSAGGLISAALLAVPGASAYFMGGGVIYTHGARRALLRVADEAMTGIRSSSEPYALVKARANAHMFFSRSGSPVSSVSARSTGPVTAMQAWPALSP